MKKLTCILLLIIGCAGASRAQQDPQYSQYMFNGLLLNPAYAGSRELLSITGLLRKQWVGIDGAPQTQTLSAHGPSRNLRHGFGISLWNDQLGVTRKTGVNLSYAYRIPVGKGMLSLGLQGGILNHKLRWSMLQAVDADNVIPKQDISAILPVAGTGVYYNSERFYAGVSMPNIIRNMVRNPNSISKDVAARMERHVFATAGVVIPLTHDLDLKPSVLMKYVRNAPVQLDFNASLFFRRTFWLGLSYRTGDSMVFLFEYVFRNQLRLGYAYDLTLTKLSGYNSGSHEIMLGLDLGNRMVKLKTPRFF